MGRRPVNTPAVGAELARPLRLGRGQAPGLQLAAPSWEIATIRNLYAYLHGFASGPQATKGRALAEAFSERGLELALPDLNRPSFAALSPGAMLEAIDELDAAALEARTRLCLIGSSLGGYLAAYWAGLHPARVRRLVLLCPGFRLAERWPHMIGTVGFERWRQQGFFPFVNGAGHFEDVHWAFFEESSRLPPEPEVPCPTLILHGRRDEVVPIDTSRNYSDRHADRCTLVELDDDHQMHASVQPIIEETMRFMEL